MRVGIDIGGMTIKAGLVDDRYQIVDKKTIKTNSETESAEQTIRRMAALIRELLKENHVAEEQCESVGIACPGTVDPVQGTVVYSNNIRWENVPILAWLKEQVDIPMYLANDADAAALGETLGGAAKGRKNAILLTLGTGVGGGVIMDGRIFLGPLRGGCEPGHMVIEHNGRLCSCGRRGCLEMYASASALMRSAREKAEKYPDSQMNILSGNNPETIDGRTVTVLGNTIFQSAIVPGCIRIRKGSGHWNCQSYQHLPAGSCDPWRWSVCPEKLSYRSAAKAGCKRVFWRGAGRDSANRNIRAWKRCRNDRSCFFRLADAHETGIK